MKLSLREYISNKDKKQTYVTQMFNNASSSYDIITRVLSFGLDSGWKKKLVELIGKDSRIGLDAACGTGDVSFLIAQKSKDCIIIGLDLAGRMLERARIKREHKSLAQVCLCCGDILSLPFQNQVFDFITASYALRNVPDVMLALVEFKRALKPGGVLFSLDFGFPKNRVLRFIFLFYLKVLGPFLGILFHADPDIYGYIYESLKIYEGPEMVKKRMNECGFVETRVIQFLHGIIVINIGKKI